jgi:hypothetical protein
VQSNRRRGHWRVVTHSWVAAPSPFSSLLPHDACHPLAYCDNDTFTIERSQADRVTQLFSAFSITFSALVGLVRFVTQHLNANQSHFFTLARRQQSNVTQNRHAIASNFYDGVFHVSFDTPAKDENTINSLRANG